jgi:pilus assembly protein HofN
MSHIVNFLPWRETRRRQRLRMAGLLIVGLLLILLVAILASRLNQRVSHSLETARISADDQLYSALQQRERAMRRACSSRNNGACAICGERKPPPGSQRYRR